MLGGRYCARIMILLPAEARLVTAVWMALTSSLIVFVGGRSSPQVGRRGQ